MMSSISETTPKIRKVIDVAISTLQNQFTDIEGFYLAGSQNHTKVRSEIQSDIDLHIIIDRHKIRELEFSIKSNRYGNRFDVKGFTRASEIIMNEEKYLVDFFLLPISEFNNAKKLLNTHSLYAASSNLYHSKYVSDPNWALHDTQQILKRYFLNPSCVVERMKFVKSLLNRKLVEFAKDLSSGKDQYVALWEGPFWALLNTGNLILTARGVTPTFLKHLLLVKGISKSLDVPELYEWLIEIWGFTHLSDSSALEFLEVLKKVYNEIQNEEISKSFELNNLRLKYWINSTNYYLKTEDKEVGIFALLYSYCQILSYQKKLPSISLSDFRYSFDELITNLGFGIIDDCAEKIKAITDHSNFCYITLKSKVYELNTLLR